MSCMVWFTNESCKQTGGKSVILKIKKSEFLLHFFFLKMVFQTRWYLMYDGKHRKYKGSDTGKTNWEHTVFLHVLANLKQITLLMTIFKTSPDTCFYSYLVMTAQKDLNFVTPHSKHNTFPCLCQNLVRITWLPTIKTHTQKKLVWLLLLKHFRVLEVDLHHGEKTEIRNNKKAAWKVAKTFKKNLKHYSMSAVMKSIYGIWNKLAKMCKNTSMVLWQNHHCLPRFRLMMMMIFFL